MAQAAVLSMLPSMGRWPAMSALPATVAVLALSQAGKTLQG